MITFVSHVEFNSSDSEFRIIVTRLPDNTYTNSIVPNPRDFPSDFKQALRNWLDSEDYLDVPIGAVMYPGLTDCCNTFLSQRDERFASESECLSCGRALKNYNNQWTYALEE